MDRDYIRFTLKDIVTETKECKNWIQNGKFPMESMARIKTLMSCLQVSLSGTLCCLHLLINSYVDFYEQLSYINKTNVRDLLESHLWAYYIKQLTFSLKQFGFKIHYH